jgi:hypothetical protein
MYKDSINVYIEKSVMISKSLKYGLNLVVLATLAISLIALSCSLKILKHFLLETVIYTI